MDPSALTALIPQGGVAAILLAVIGILLRQNHQDRAQYRQDVARIEKRAADEAKTAAEHHSAEMTEVRKEIAGLREELRKSLDETEDERRKRWHAEDEAARYRRQVQALTGEAIQP